MERAVIALQMLCLVLAIVQFLVESAEVRSRHVSTFATKPYQNVAFYHVYAAGGTYRDIVEEQLGIMKETGLEQKLDAVFYFPVGSQSASFHIPKPNFHRLHIDNATGWEEDTLGALYEFCHAHPTTNVLYFHDKGSFHSSPANIRFRKVLDCYVLNPNCIEALKTYDTCGWRVSPVPYIHYSGNFWWATCRHINRLIHPSAYRVNETFIQVSSRINECSNHSDRFFAEQWVGTYPVFAPADCFGSAYDTSYLFGYSIPDSALKFCPSPQTNTIGLPCSNASTLVNGTDFIYAYANIYPKMYHCRERDGVLHLRSELWYGQPPETYENWIRLLRRPIHQLKEGDAVRPSDDQVVYLYEHNQLRSIPDATTFFSLGLRFENVVVIYPHEMKMYKMGPPFPSKA